MPTEALFINSQLFALYDEDQEEGEYLDMEDLDGIRLVFEPDADFLEMTREEVYDMTLETGAIFQNHFYQAALEMQERLRVAEEVADLIMRAEEGDADWEL